MPVALKNGVSVLFVHVPKAGGTYVLNSLKFLGWKVFDYDRSDPRRPGTPNYFRQVSPQHISASEMKTRYHLDHIDYKFMSVRNPYHRLESEYFWQKRRFKSASGRPFPGPDSWWQQVKPKIQDSVPHFDNHLKPQVAFFLPNTQVYKLEDGLSELVRDIDKLAGPRRPERLNMAVRLSPRNAAAGRNSLSLGFSRSTIEDIRDTYTQDFITFRYALEP
jgi:hypothetical protein